MTKTLLSFLISILFFNSYGQIGFQEHLVQKYDFNVANSRAISVADIDGDGYPDTVSAHFNGGLEWYKNTDNNGSIGLPIRISSSSYISLSIYTSDLDGDGDMDVLSATYNGNKVVWYENTDGLGTFGPEIIISNNVNDASVVYASDIDGDGDNDVLYGKYDNKIAWKENLDGLGNLGAEQILTTSVNGLRDIKTADIDGDGDLDVLSASENDDKIAWYENTDGVGSFGGQIIISTNVNYPQTIHTSDIDGDGDLDISTVSSDHVLVWLENTDGQGNFLSEHLTTLSDYTDYDAFETFPIDIDLDGDIDLITGGIQGSLTWFENMDGQGTFGTEHPIGFGRGGISFKVADMDLDGDLDVVFISSYDVFWSRNIDGFGLFELSIEYTLNSPDIISTSDIDGDGDQDMIVTSFDQIAWFENLDGQGSMGAPNFIWYRTHDSVANTSSGTSANNSGVSFTDIFISDVDGDGDMDVLSSSYSEAKIAWYENTDGLGTFGPRQIVSNTTLGAESVYSEDLDGDGDMDIIGSSRNSKTISWYENIDGVGTFGTQQIITTQGVKFKAFDMDSDGDIDIVSSMYDKVSWQENIDGLGTFGAEQILSNDGAIDIYVSDLDGDGDQDIIYSPLSADKIAWFENSDGLGNFGNEQSITTSVSGIGGIRTTDIDGDGDLDLLSFSYEDWTHNKITWYENTNGLGVLGNEQIITTFHDDSPIRQINSTDMNGDGKIDIIATLESYDMITWFENIGVLDQDNDGITDNNDNCPLIANTNQLDTDNDGLGDVCDDDDDNDGILDVNDNCPLVANTNQLDTDNDGSGDICDDDDDNDGILDVNDNCPLIANINQLDTDNDGLGDVCDDDDDNDGILDVNDNCQLVANTNQLDTDNDGLGDVCDDDDDDDGILDVDDDCQYYAGSNSNNGCPLILPYNNFSIETLSETCINQNNAQIIISAVTNYNYVVTLTLNGNPVTLDTNTFTTNLTIDGLSSGAYVLCINIPTENYIQCFNVGVDEPANITGVANINEENNRYSLSLTGGITYNIDFNTEHFVLNAINESTPVVFEKQLSRDVNTIRVTTNKNCQGQFEEIITIDDFKNFMLYPNPTNDNVYISTISDKENGIITITDVCRKIIWTKSIQLPLSNYNIKTDKFSTGIYFIQLVSPSLNIRKKIIKN
jgi:hypothetical protein